MTAFEDAREFQIAMEHDRRARSELGTVLSAQDELQDAAQTLEHHRSGMEAAVLDELFAAVSGTEPRPEDCP